MSDTKPGSMANKKVTTTDEISNGLYVAPHLRKVETETETKTESDLVPNYENMFFDRLKHDSSERFVTIVAFIDENGKPKDDSFEEVDDIEDPKSSKVQAKFTATQSRIILQYDLEKDELLRLGVHTGNRKNPKDRAINVSLFESIDKENADRSALNTKTIYSKNEEEIFKKKYCCSGYRWLDVKKSQYFKTKNGTKVHYTISEEDQHGDLEVMITPAKIQNIEHKEVVHLYFRVYESKLQMTHSKNLSETVEDRLDD